MIHCKLQHNRKRWKKEERELSTGVVGRDG
jgi:hypothetical protein